MEMQEDWMERFHQFGNAMMKKFASVRDYNVKSIGMARSEAVQNDRSVLEKSEAVKLETKRKRNGNADEGLAETNRATKKQVRDEKREAALESSKLVSPTKLPSGSEMEKKRVQAKLNEGGDFAEKMELDYNKNRSSTQSK